MIKFLDLPQQLRDCLKIKYLTAENRRVITPRTAKIHVSSWYLCGPQRRPLCSLRLKKIMAA